MNKKKKLILVVDDEKPIVELMELILNDAGYEVATSLDGETLKKVPRLKPDLILLDLMMPGMDGLEISHRLKADPATKHIPILLMTASATRLAKQHTHIDGFLSKPFDLDQLLYTIQKLI